MLHDPLLLVLPHQADQSTDAEHYELDVGVALGAGGLFVGVAFA